MADKKAAVAPAQEPAPAEEKKKGDPLKRFTPTEVDWSETIWPMDNVLSGIGGVTKGVADAGGGALSSINPFTQDEGGGFGGGSSAGAPGVEGKTKEEVAAWLSDNELDALVSAFDAAEIDGMALQGLCAMWQQDKIGFCTFSREQLKILSPGQCLRLGVLTTKLRGYKWPKGNPKADDKEDPPKAAVDGAATAVQE